MTETQVTRTPYRVAGVGITGITAIVTCASLLPVGTQSRIETSGFDRPSRVRQAAGFQEPDATTSASGSLRLREFTEGTPESPEGTATAWVRSEGRGERSALPIHQDIESTPGSHGSNLERIKLLARKYVEKHFSVEEEARLAVVTERTKRLFPSVSAEDAAALREISCDLDTMRDQVLRIKEELNIDGQEN